MKGETKGVLGVMFGIFAFADPVSSLFVLIYNLSLYLDIGQLTNSALLSIYTIIHIIASLVFIVLAFYFSVKARKEKSRKLGNWGITLGILSLLHLIWYTWGFLRMVLG